MLDEDAIAELESKGKLGWRAASNLVKPFRPVAANFGEAIRNLVGNYQNGGQLALPAQNHVIRLLKNNTIKAVYYFVSKAYRPEVIVGKNPLTVNDLFKAYSPIEHAAILSFCYLFRTLSRKTDLEEWDYVQAPLYEALSLGSAIGQSVPDVGLAFGMLSRGVRYLAFAPFVVGNRRGFKEYRRHLKAQDLPFDTEFEMKTWECTSLQVASMLLTTVGFNRTAVQQLVAAAQRDPELKPDDLWGVRFRMANAILDEYMETGEIMIKCPEWVGKSYSLPSEMRADLLKSFHKALNEETKIEWLNKGSFSINPDSTPEFFASGGAAPQVSSAATAPNETSETTKEESPGSQSTTPDGAG